MARFSVPSASSASSDAGPNSSERARSRSQSPPGNGFPIRPRFNKPRPYSKRPPMFRDPSASTSPPSSNDGSHPSKRSRSRSRSPENSGSAKPSKRGCSIFRAPSASSLSSGSDRSPATPGSPKQPKRSNPTCRVPSASSSSGGSDGSRTLSRGSGSPARNPLRSRSPSPSPPPTSSKLAVALMKKPGELGQFQANTRSLIVLNEKSGKLPRLGTTSPRSPGFSWDDGAVWWLPKAEHEDVATNGQTLVSREHVHEDDDPGPGPATMESVINLLAHDNLVRPFGHAGFDSDDTRNETAWEFMDAGTLNRLIMSRKTPPGIPTKKIVTGLPEYLVWHTLVSLLRAIVYLQIGAWSSEDEYDDPDWRPIVHDFINPANVFFTHLVPGDDGQTPTYGMCKLGNFSRCTILPHDIDPVSDEEVADRREAFGHILALEEETGYEAPEVLVETSEFPSPRSDLWSIGAVSLAMMTGRTVWDFLLEYEFQDRVRRRRGASQIPEAWQDTPLAHRHALLLSLNAQGRISSGLPERYSHELRVLVEALLVVDPEDRGEANHVLRDVEGKFESKRVELEGMVELSEYQLEDAAAEEVIRRSRASRGMPPELTAAERSTEPLCP